MATPQETVDKIKELFKMVSESVSQKDFLEAFKTVTKLVLDTEIKMTKRVNTILTNSVSELQAKFSDLAEKDTTGVAQMKADCIAVLNKMMKEQADGLNFMRDKVRSLVQAKDGHTPTEAELLTLITPLIPQLPEIDEETPEQTRDKLETLEGDNRLDKSAVKGIEQIEEDIKEVKSRPSRGTGGGKGFTLYVNGVKKLLTAQTINITGSGVTYNYSNGRNDITITGGSGAFSVLAATGAIDGSNAVFTFPSAPTVVVLNGATYRNGAGVTIVGTTATLDVAPQTGSDVYGIG